MASYPLTVFFDGACPICDREIALMRRLDRHRRLLLCDFSRPDYDPTSINISPAELGRIIHARWGDGTVITAEQVLNTDAYLCGGRPMIEEAKQLLINKGMQVDHIRHETFF